MQHELIHYYRDEELDQTDLLFPSSRAVHRPMLLLQPACISCDYEKPLNKSFKQFQNLQMGIIVVTPSNKASFTRMSLQPVPPLEKAVLQILSLVKKKRFQSIMENLKKSAEMHSQELRHKTDGNVQPYVLFTFLEKALQAFSAPLSQTVVPCCTIYTWSCQLTRLQAREDLIQPSLSSLFLPMRLTNNRQQPKLA